ncbi:hypothetical protein BDP27DRAFT_1237859 [Rhodocollybia butyracea]|uniref:RING-type domain-containing protein n=1 Tax=Rhodocollybia butyracea TaxID=206335 RepID=A0A9P5PAM8_9AGAR|nr:hypothetical protein BDP27DRAFT_1237859 [Rhodocollybia butyracea]
MARSESKRAACQEALQKSGDEYQKLYCSLCHFYANSKNSLRLHMETSPRHPRCDVCERSFLNLNSLRRHYILSDRHSYCPTCDKLFDNPLALKIHDEYTTFHRDERNEEEDTIYAEERRRFPKTWENRTAAEIKRRESIEDAIAVDEHEELSRVQVTMKILELKQRMNRQREQKVLKQTCAICLCVPKKMCVTRCGHMFCSSCIHHTFEQGQGCPSCRKLGNISQLRTVDLSVVTPTD